jgi:hypothetical protein
MTSATRIVASVLGVYAGLLGATHGVLEILQGSIAPRGVLIQAIGPPCEMSEVWHGCWPAVTLVPNYLVTGVLATVVSLAVLVWAALFVERKHGGLVLIVLSIMMLPVGGGFIPAVLGAVAGLVGTRVNAPLTWWQSRLSGRALRSLARQWPWPFVAYFVWIPAQWVLGHFFNEFMLERGFLFMLLEFGLLLLSVVTGFAHDIEKTQGDNE